MTTATREEAPTRAGFPAFDWETLIDLIEERQVVPVIGRELVKIVDPEDGKEKTLVRWLSSQLAKKLGEVSPPTGFVDDGSGLTLDQFVSGHVLRGGSARDVSATISSLLKKNDFEPSETLKKLARIKEFDLFITTTFDHQLRKALDEVRHEGREGTDVIAYQPKKIADIPQRKESLAGTTLYHLLGRVSAIPRSFVVSEEDMLEWMAALQSATFTPQLLSEELENSQLLLLGLQCNDWLARFFIRMAKRKRLSERRDFGEVLADKRSTQDGDLCQFLSAFSRDTLIFSKDGGAKKFVDELHDRYHGTRPVSYPKTTTTGRSNPGGPVRFLPPDKEMPPNAVFISYSRDDLEVVKRLKAKLDAANVKSWFDMDELNGGDDFKHKIKKNIGACSFFIPVISSSTAEREEGFFRLEWTWASERKELMKPGALFLFPVVIDDQDNFNASDPPAKIQEASFINAPEGELPDDFVNHLAGLLQGASPRK